MDPAKAEAIRATRRATKERRKDMIIKTYFLKIDRSHLNRESLRVLERLFLEAKWFYNDMIARGDVWNAPYKRREVLVMDRDGNLVPRRIEFLRAQVRQEMVARARDSIVSIARLRQKGYRVGKLRFKDRITSIPLLQYGQSFEFKGPKRIWITGVKQHMLVRGREQIPAEAEIATATLGHQDRDFFVRVVTFQPREVRTFPRKSIGIDFGIERHLTLSNGLAIRLAVYSTKREGRLRRELSRRASNGANRSKTLQNLRHERLRIVRRRKDIVNKVVSRLTSRYETIAIQDEPFDQWRSRWGREAASAALGRFSAKLERKANALVMVRRFTPTTRRCSNCRAERTIGGRDAVYACDRCGLRMDRDLNAAVNIWSAVPAERREFTPVDIESSTELMEYMNTVPHVSACLVDDAGSLQALAGSSPRNLSEPRKKEELDSVPELIRKMVAEYLEAIGVNRSPAIHSRKGGRRYRSLAKEAS